MKRPPGLWILLSAGLLWLSLEDVDGVRATSLIFAKTSTTTSTTTPAPSSEEEGDTTEPVVDTNSTKPSLTGVPQLDYVWDPNLPKELNGYNLSDYPFYERVPEDIDFKCDGLHDGFYASVKHKCQVYHHCLFGTRYDFLCANYTAFDQKTFICHFASEVDCVNSKKFWHRNDALYQAATTTTPKPLVIHTTAPPQPILPAEPSAPGRRPYPRRPFRRRPQYDYYDDEYYDYYEDRPRSNRGRKRPRPRPRPYYEDDYDDDYDYERRVGAGRRRVVPAQGRRRYKGDRLKGDYEDEEERRLSKDLQVQVYHHCLFGVRYDFLCANYTAFDQTLFNCNFVSNVDCENSKRFWHRNDELYVTKSTTTTPAPIVYAFYTPPTQLYAGAQRSRGSVTQLRNQAQAAAAQQPSPEAASPQAEQPAIAQQPQPQVVYIDPGLEPKRRPRPQRRRPVYDYYDDYEERPRRPRPRRPRPLYYDYEDYEGDRYDRRGGTRRRRPYERRPTMRENERRRKYDYDDDEDYLEEEYDDLVLDKKKPSRKRKFDDDVIDETRRDRNRSQPKPKPGLGVRRPPSEDYEDELQKSDKSDTSTRSRKSSKEGTYKGDENQSLAKPAGLYDRPRPSPKINVPRNSYKNVEESEDSTVATTTSAAATTTTPRPSTSRFSLRKRAKQTESIDNMSTSTTSEAVTVLRKFKRPVNRQPPEEEKPAPVRVKVPIRLTKLNEKTTEPTQLDTLYDTYDVTLNEASPVADLAPYDEYALGYSKERK